MELMELVEYFAFNVTVKDAREEIEKYRDILDESAIEDKVFFGKVHSYIVEYKNRISNLDSYKLINDYSFKRALKTYRELFKDTGRHPADVFNELIKQICLQKSCFNRCDCSDNSERKEIVKFLGREDTVKFMAEVLPYWKNMCEPGHYLFFIGFCLGMRYMGDDRIAFDFQGWFDRPDVTGKFIHDKIDELIQIDEIYAERVEYENEYLSLCEIEDMLFEEKSKRVFELADKMNNGTISEKSEIRNDMFKMEMELGGISSKRVDGALERIKKACINYYGHDISSRFEWKYHLLARNLYRLDRQVYSIKDIVECFDIGDNVDGLVELFDEEKLSREEFDAQMLIFLGHVFHNNAGEIAGNSEAEKLIKSDKRLSEYFNRLTDLYYHCSYSIMYTPRDKYYALIYGTLMAFSDEKRIQRFLKRMLLEIGESLNELIAIFAYDAIGAFMEFNKDEFSAERAIRYRYETVECTAFSFICGCLLDPEAYAPVSNFDYYFSIYFMQNVYDYRLNNTGKEFRGIVNELYEMFDKRIGNDESQDIKEIRELFVSVCEAEGGLDFGSRKYINHPFVTWKTSEDYQRELTCEALAIVETERRKNGQASLMKMSDRDLNIIYGLVLLIVELSVKIEDNRGIYPRYMDINEPVKNELIKMADLVLEDKGTLKSDEFNHEKELNELRNAVRQLKSSYNSLYDEYKKFKDADEKDNRELDELRDTVNRQNKELDRLYELENKYNELLLKQNKTDYSEIERVLGSYKIMIAGGHSETTRRLGAKYENMRFVSVVNEIGSSIRNMDYVFVIRRFNSHAMWQKIISELQGSDVRYMVIDVNSNLRQTEEAMYLHIVKEGNL